MQKEAKQYNPIMGLRVPPELRDKFTEHARAQDLTPSQVARKLIREWVVKQDKKSGKA